MKNSLKSFVFFFYLFLFFVRLQTGLFKWTPDFEMASGHFQKAGVAYQLAGLFDNSIKAYKRAAHCCVQMKT